MPETQNCGYSQLSPNSPAGGSQKHRPSSHFWPFAQVSADTQGEPLTRVTTAESVQAPRSSHARILRSTMLFGRLAGMLMPYGDGLAWPVRPNAAPFASPHLKLLITSSTFDTPRWLPAFAATNVPSIVAPGWGVVIITVGGGTSSGPGWGSKTERSLPCEFWLAPHWQLRGWYSPQAALSLRKNF